MKVAKLMHSIESGTNRDLGDYVWFKCPGCNEYHRARVRMPNEPTEQEREDQINNIHGLWTWNINEEKPTIRNSILLGIQIQGKRCHSYITEGKIEFCSDSEHSLSGKIVDLPEINF